MIATLLLTGFLASVTFVFAAYCAERGLHALRLPTRVPWIVAIAATVAIPATQWIALSVSSPAAAAESSRPFELPTIVTVAVLQRVNDSTLRDLDRWLLGFWLLGSFSIIVRLVLASHGFRNRARTWKRAQLFGVNLWLSEHYGPAVIGAWDAEIVIPRRMLDLPPQDQRLALAHELEHIAARDQWFVRCAALALAILPWNPCLWFATRRLRSAIETDCDTRVLKQKPNAAEYASLVLTVASWARQAPTGTLGLGEMALRELERRLRLMTNQPRARRPASAAVFFVAASGLALYGCRTAATVKRPEPRVHELPTIVTTATPIATGKPYFEFQVDKPATPARGNPAPLYPEMLRETATGGEVLAQFVVDTEGNIELGTLKIVRSSHELFVQAVRDILPQMRFTPAEVKGTKVKQLVQQPFAFAIAQ